MHSERIQRLKEARDSVQKNLDDLDTLLRTALIEEYPLKVGMVVQATDGQLATVTTIFAKTRACQAGWHGLLHKKDGTVGLRKVPQWRGVWKVADIKIVGGVTS